MPSKFITNNSINKDSIRNIDSKNLEKILRKNKLKYKDVTLEDFYTLTIDIILKKN